MSPTLRFLHDLSYSMRGLKTSCAVILLIGFSLASFLGTALSLLLPDEEVSPDIIEVIYEHHLLMTIPQQHRQDFQITEDDLESWSTFLENPQSKPPNEFMLLPPEYPMKQGQNFAYGLYELREGNPLEALAFLQKENQAFPHFLVRKNELTAALRTNDLDLILSYMDKPGYEDVATAGYYYRAGVNLEEWPLIFKNFWRAMYQRIEVNSLFLALIAGVIWTILTLSLYAGKPPRIFIVFVPLAISLGWISTWPTIWSSIWMDAHLHIEEGTDFFSALLYYLVSVGLREELCKLLLFTPFLFRVLKPGRDLEALILGALVGLGFAIEENISYFSNYEGSGVVIRRFVSANLLHLSLTAVTALALTRALRNPGKWTTDAVQTLAMAIGLHGLYNTLLSQPIPGMGDMSYFSDTALVGCAYLFFREVETLSPIQAFKVSRTALFCWGFCLLFNLELLQGALSLPFRDALYFTGKSALSSVMIGYIFIHMVREPLGP